MLKKINGRFFESPDRSRVIAELEQRMTGLFTLNLYAAGIILVFSPILDSYAKASFPYFVREPESVIMQFGSNATFFCDVKPEDAMVWFSLNGKPLESKEMLVLPDGRAVHIPFRLSSDEGVCQCFASNSFGTIVSQPATLTRAVLLPQYEQLPDREIITVRGNVAIIPCAHADSIPPARVEFEFNGTRLELAKRHFTLPSGNLQIKDVDVLNEGVYRCVWINPVNHERMPSLNTVHLKVVESANEIAPRFTWTPLTNVEVVSGHTLVLECVAEGWPVPVVQWLKYGGHLPAGRHSQLLGNLVIENVQDGDEGTYICRAENIAGQPQANVAFVEILEPPRIVLPPVDLNISLHSTVAMLCHVTGKPTPRVTWYHDGKPLRPSSHVTITNTSLIIINVRFSAAGIYQCMATNAIATVHSSCQLQIFSDKKGAESARKHRQNPKGSNFKAGNVFRENQPRRKNVQKVPSQFRKIQTRKRNQSADQRKRKDEDQEESPWRIPVVSSEHQEQNRRQGEQKPKNGGIDVILVPPSKPNVTKLSETSILLQWNVPPNDGLRITFYKIQYKEITDSVRKNEWQTIDKDIAPTLNSFKVDTGLKSGNVYQFRIVAVYSNLDNKHGPNSARVTLGSSVRTRVPQHGPIVVRVWSTSSTTLSIEWQYLPSQRIPIDGFYVHYKPYESDVNYVRKMVLGPDVRATVLSGLEADTLYSIRIQGFNAFGESEFSNTAVKFTLGDLRSLKEGSHRSKSTSLPFFIPETKWPSSKAEPQKTASIRDYGVSTYANHLERRQGMLGDDSLYIVLGAVLGTVLIIFIVLLMVCLWKQCQQRQIYALQENLGNCPGAKLGTGVGVGGDGDKYNSPRSFMFMGLQRMDSEKEQSNGQLYGNVVSHRTSSSYVDGALDEIRCSLGAVTQMGKTDKESGEERKEYCYVENGYFCTGSQSLHFLKLNIKKLHQLSSFKQPVNVTRDKAFCTEQTCLDTSHAKVHGKCGHFKAESKSADDLRALPATRLQSKHHLRRHHLHSHFRHHGRLDCRHHHHHRHQLQGKWMTRLVKLGEYET